MFWGAQNNRLTDMVLLKFPKRMFLLRNKKYDSQIHTLIWRPEITNEDTCIRNILPKVD